MRTDPAAFDVQAGRYDARAGLPGPAGLAVARAVATCIGADPVALVVELGAGTGEIGLHLARQPIRYLGLDGSRAMLEVFRGKAVDGPAPLAVADCELPWPLRDGSAAAVFASRTIHLLQPDHVARESRRICRPGGSLVLGRVVRDPDGVAERLRRRRLELLRERGISGRQGEDGTRRVIEECLALGGTSAGRRIVAEWTGTITPESVIAGWEALPRMGSVPVGPALQAEILAEVRHWALAEFGDLGESRTTVARYAIDIVGLP